MKTSRRYVYSAAVFVVVLLFVFPALTDLTLYKLDANYMDENSAMLLWGVAGIGLLVLCGTFLRKMYAIERVIIALVWSLFCSLICAEVARVILSWVHGSLVSGAGTDSDNAMSTAFIGVLGAIIGAAAGYLSSQDASAAFVNFVLIPALSAFGAFVATTGAVTLIQHHDTTFAGDSKISLSATAVMIGLFLSGMRMQQRCKGRRSVKATPEQIRALSEYMVSTYADETPEPVEWDFSEPDTDSDVDSVSEADYDWRSEERNEHWPDHSYDQRGAWVEQLRKPSLVY